MPRCLKTWLFFKELASSPDRILRSNTLGLKETKKEDSKLYPQKARIYSKTIFFHKAINLRGKM